ncbi:MAG: GHKL domain-containing protein [Fluviicola sp.]|nr:GHKL domain-containing protein [Fluviicola sp.]
MFKKIKKYYILLVSVAFTVAFLLLYLKTFSTNYTRSVKSFKSEFLTLENKLDETLKYRTDELKYGSIKEQWERSETSSSINVHVYRKDSLVYWNTNQLPILRFADLHFPSDGIIHLQNGWYYAKMKTVRDFQVCVSFLIKQDYSYNNKELINDFTTPLDLSFNSSISLDEDSDFPIFSKEKKFVFSIVPNNYQSASRTESILLMLSLLIAISSWLYWLSFVKKQLRKNLQWLLPSSVVIFRILSVKFSWFGFLHGTTSFESSLYGVSQWFPNFFEYVVNIIVFIYLLNELSIYLKSEKRSRIKAYIGVLFFIASFLIWAFILDLTKGLIESSSISLVIDELFSLDIFSFLAIASLGVFFYAYFKFVQATVQACKNQLITGAQMAVLSFILSFLFFLFEINYGNQLLLAALFPVVFYELVLYLIYRNKKSNPLGAGILLLLLFSVVLASVIGTFNDHKEKGERELYARQLITEKNIVTEVEYSNVVSKLKNDKFLQRFISYPRPINISSFQEGLERRVFNDYWERYELDFHLFDAQHLPLIDKIKNNSSHFDELNALITISGTPSEIDSNIFFIDDFTQKYNYVIRQELYGKDSTKAIFFCTLKSKKIPEEIGFPRLLISSKSNVLESLESYSIARFHNKRLVTKYGGFNYPSSPGVMLPNNKGNAFFDFNGFNHYALVKSENHIVVLSVKNDTFLDFITSFSYLFSLYGLLLMPFLFRMNSKGGFNKTLSLAMKIQVVLIGLVFISLLAFGWGSGLFVTSQYNQLTNDVIGEKLNSVETEVKAKLGEYETLDIVENGNYMQYILQKFARVFFTDINLYDTEGYLLASSRPKVFNVGLLSEQMNPEAVKHLKYLKESEFVHKENIGELDYSSAYKPFYNSSNKLMGYINLQHFGQQREFENQIQKFLVAIINVFILLLAISIILAIFISNWLTSPLRILQENFSNVEFGKQNQQILYDKEDEIGSLVKDYNRKLEELEFTAQQLAKSEREMAWREMAKQVAHEIKNPLTPMKLSVQQLLRTFDPNDPKSEEKLKKVANSIVEQIDALTKIANEFSNFAKMPNPSEEKVDLVALANGVVEVFTTSDSIEINLEANKEQIFLLADKDQFVRVFNNLIKNAIQAIPQGEKGLIKISLEAKSGEVKVAVSDNGIGIEESKQGKIFVPYFTTKSTGTGLGLAMVKQIIENHKGSIDFESEVGRGTTFTFVLPI